MSFPGSSVRGVVREAPESRSLKVSLVVFTLDTKYAYQNRLKVFSRPSSPDCCKIPSLISFSRI